GAAGFRPRPQGAGWAGRIAGGESLPARAAARLRFASSPERGRFAGCADAARARGYLDDADLHPCARRAFETPARRAPPAGARRLTSEGPADTFPPLWTHRASRPPRASGRPRANIIRLPENGRIACSHISISKSRSPNSKA